MPIQSDWTVGDVLSWLADDDDRCHDEALRPLLARLDGGVPDDRAAIPAPIALVRSLAARVRATPALRLVRVGDLADVTVLAGASASIVGRATARAEVGASARRPALRHA